MPLPDALAVSFPARFIASRVGCALAPADEGLSYHGSLFYGLLSTQEITLTSILHANMPQTLGSCLGERRTL